MMWWLEFRRVLFRSLSAAQQADVAAAIIEGPQAHGYATAMWTLPRIAKLIEQRTRLGYHPNHVWRVLRGLGFSCQQPTRRAIERDEVEIGRASCRKEGRSRWSPYH